MGKGLDTARKRVYNVKNTIDEKGVFMKLTYSQLQSVTVGATRLEQTEDGIRFWRMTEAQIQHYYDRGDEHQALNGVQSAGVRLAFVTDSSFVAFSAKLLPDLSGYHAFDVWVDGVMVAHFGKENVAPENCRVELGAGEKLVEIYLPWSKIVILRELLLDDGATLVPHKRSRKLLAFGDSITHGACSTYPSLCYIQRLAALLDADLENRGVGGDKFSPVIIDEEPRRIVAMSFCEPRSWS